VTGPIDTDAQLDWVAPATPGQYVIRYTATGNEGTYSDDVVVTVTDVPTGPQAFTPDPIPSQARVGEPTFTVDPPPGATITRWGVNTTWGSFAWGYSPDVGPQPGTFTPDSIPSRAIVGQPTFTVDPVPVPLAFTPDSIASRATLGAPSFTVGSAPPDQPITDLTISLFAIDPQTGRGIPLPSRQKLDLSPLRNSGGSIALDYPADGENFAVLRDALTNKRDVEVEVWFSGSSLGAKRGYLQEAAGDDIAEDGVWSFSGGFLGIRMDEAVVLPQDPGPLVPDDDDDPTNDKHANEKRELIFNAATPGTVMATAMEQAHEHGWLTDIVYDFTAAADSDGVPWPQVMTTKFSPGATYGQLLDRLNVLGLAEWDVVWDGAHRVLKLWVPEGRGEDLTVLDPPVVLRHGQNLLDAPKKWSVRETGTDVLVAGADGLYDEASDPAAVLQRGRRIARFISANNLADAQAVTAHAINQLPVITEPTYEVTHGIGFVSGQPRPLVSYDIGDWVLSESGGTQERLRVVQWTLTEEKDQGLSGTVTLNDTVTDWVVRLKAQLEAITSGETVVGTSTPPSGSLSDITPPAAPEGLTASSIAYQDPAHTNTLASVTVGWLPVRFNADGSNYPQVQAARYIILKIQDDLEHPQDPEDEDYNPIMEDWTWVECPQVVVDHNVELLAAWQADGAPGANQEWAIQAEWLQSYVDSFSATPTATDDVAGYRIRYAYIGLDQVGGLPSSDPFPDDQRFYYEVTPTTGITSTSYTFGGVEGGANIRIEVCAFDRSGNQGPWASIGHDTAVDDTAPNQPSAPGAEATWRGVMVSWDGLDLIGAPMPVDFDHVEVWIAQDSSFANVPPDRATDAVPFDPSIPDAQHVGNLFAAGTHPVQDMLYGVGYYAALRAVDRAGNASPLSQVVGPRTADKLVSDDLINEIINDPNMIAAETIHTLHVVDGAIVNAKIADLAVNNAKIADLEVGKLRSGTMIAQVTISGKFRTHESDAANRVEFDAAGLRLYRGTTVVGDWNVASGNITVTGTYQSALTGERINIFPDGTLRFYPQSGTNYSQMSTVGAEVIWRGPLDPNGRSGRLNVNALGVGMNYSAESEIPNRLRAEIALFDRRTRVTSPFQALEVDGRYDNPAGGPPRVQFSQLSSSGTALPYSYLSYMASSSSGRGGFWGNGAGIKFEAGQVLVTGDELDGFGVIKASEFAVSSSAAVKRDIVDIEDPSVPIDVEGVFRDAPAVQFNYLTDPVDARPRLGVLAEQMPEALQRVDSDGAGGTVLSLGIADRLGLHHAAIRQIYARLRALEGRE
jgi:hypothetical protein